MSWPGPEVLYLNSIARTLLGYADDDPVGGLSALTLVAPGDRGRLLERAAQQLAGSVAQGRPYRRQKGQEILALTGIRKDGSTFPAEIQAAYVLDPAGFPTGVRFVFWDITDRVELEREKRQLEILVRQSQKLESLGHLAGGIAHDFNNLLTVIVGNLHLLRPFLGDDPLAAEYVSEAELAAERGADLVRGLLTFARPRSASPTLSTSPVPLPKRRPSPLRCSPLASSSKSPRRRPRSLPGETAPPSSRCS